MQKAPSETRPAEAPTKAQRDNNKIYNAVEKTAFAAVLAKLHVDSVDSIRDYSLLQKLTGVELDVVHKFKLGKGAVADKRAAVAVALGVDVMPVGDAPDC